MRKILVVEDSPVTSLLLRKALERRGYAVDVSPGVLDCFNRLANNIHYDLAIVDFWLGKYGTGAEVEKVLSRLRIKAMYYTADESVTSRAIPVILKGDSLDNLLIAVEEQLGGPGPAARDS